MEQELDDPGEGDAEGFDPYSEEQDEISEAMQAWGADDSEGRVANDFDDDSEANFEADGEDEDTRYSLNEETEELEEVIEAIDEQRAGTESPVAHEILKGNKEMVQRSIKRVEKNPHDLSMEKLWLSDRLVGEDKIEELEAREAKLQEQYEQAEERMDRGDLSQEVGEQDLLSIRHKQTRLESEGLMAADGLTWDMIGDLSDDVNHLVEDNECPELREARKAFRDIDWSEQREVLEKAVEKGVISPEQANWMWNQWR